MPNFKTHIGSGVGLYPLLVLIHELVQVNVKNEQIRQWLIVDPVIIAIGYAVFVFSADAPDIDHPDSIIQRIARLLLGIVVTTMVFFRLYEYWNRNQAFDRWVPLISLAFFIAILVGVFATLIFTHFMPRHRGVIHTVWAGVLYALIIAGGYWLFQQGTLQRQLLINHTIYLGVSSFLGYLLHISLDRLVTRIRRKP